MKLMSSFLPKDQSHSQSFLWALGLLGSWGECLDLLKKSVRLFALACVLTLPGTTSFFVPARAEAKTIKVSPEIRNVKKKWNGLEHGDYSIPYAGTFNRFLQSFGLTREVKGKLITYYREEKGYHFVSGKISHFGGKNDRGVSDDEKGAVTGENLRHLSAHGDYYVAMRFDYGKKVKTGRKFWKEARLLLINPKNGRSVVVRPIDWGPHPRTKRIVDASPATLNYLKLKTDESVWVSFAEQNLETGPVRDY